MDFKKIIYHRERLPKGWTGHGDQISETVIKDILKGRELCGEPQDLDY
jgi:hypothetical protein